MKPFDLQSAPLDGVTLIEAAAGTGKTYTLTGLVLRLIVECGLGIEQILVVTYTKAATEELKTRIRDRLVEARQALNGSVPDDGLLGDMLENPAHLSLARQRVEHALTNFDCAAIFTIHGFCQRVLQHYAFETGHLFDTELVQDSSPLVYEMVEDFWRRNISNAPYELAQYALQKFRGPEKLLQIINYCAYPNVKVLPEGKKPILTAIAPWRRQSHRLTRQWTQYGSQIRRLLENSGLHARHYGKTEPDPERIPWTFRQLRLAELSTALDNWNGKYPLDGKKLKYLSRPLVEKYTNKGHAVPEHPFFDTCDQALNAQAHMELQLERYLRYLKIKLLQQSRPVLDQKKSRKNIFFFDDLLLQVHSALTGGSGSALAKAVRLQYRAALVDEFQDTDLLQYEIFKRLFEHPSQMLFMIGDPKQAIYSFRGADLFSYLKAALAADKRSTLSRNWRSTATLIKAVNTLFGNHPIPFGVEQIKFNPAIAAGEDQSSVEHPLTLWYITRSEKDEPSKPLNQQEATDAIATAVAQEIVCLLNDDQGDVKPRHIAVLTRKHAQSQVVKRALARKNVPAVLHSAGSVFHTDDALMLIRVISAVAEPFDSVKVRAALAQEMFGAKASEFHLSMEASDPDGQNRWLSFYNDHQVWVRRGVYPMLRGLMIREKVKAKMLSLPNGERRLTNVLHLAELLHEAESEHGLGPEGAVKWLVEQRQAEYESDEKQLRLESDSRAVRIITMHKSKGLQFKVVFCPFIWGGVRMDKDAAVFHDAAHDNRITLALGPDIPKDQELEARKEQLAENLRMMYVALTRAKERCYVAWGRINGTELSAPAYLLHGSHIAAGNNDWLNPLAKKIKSLTDGGMIQEIRKIASQSGGSIEAISLPRNMETQFWTDDEKSIEGRHKVMGRQLAGHWPMASFSSLTSAKNTSDELPDRDVALDLAYDPGMAPGNVASLFDFPKGAQAGLFFHDVLENWDHTCKDRHFQEELIHTKLSSHGFHPQWQPVMDRLLNLLSATNLKTPNGNFSLSEVSIAHRINEMEFYYPLKRFSSEQIRECFEQYDQHGPKKMVGQRLERIRFSPSSGFMKGFIDTVFKFKQQYYLVDWKSNFLGRSLDDYAMDRLERIMVADDYFLQYHLYAVALNRWLMQRDEGYRYDRHFGGVFYIFLRGVNDGSSDHTGVFFSKPNGRLVSALDQMMIGKKRDKD